MGGVLILSAFFTIVDENKIMNEAISK